MKLLGFLRSALLVSGIFCATQAFSLTEEQRKELYHKGTVTTEDGVFEVNFMPGADNVVHDAEARWESAGNRIKELATSDFWKKKFIKSAIDGVRFAKEATKDVGVGGIPGDFKEMVEAHKAAKDSFGALAVELGNFFKFTLKSLGRVVVEPFIIVGGFGYSVVTPVARFLFRPVAAGTEAIAAGTLWPCLAYSWNGAAWKIVKNRTLKPGDMTVTFIPKHVEHIEAASNEPSEHDEVNVPVNDGASAPNTVETAAPIHAEL